MQFWKLHFFPQVSLWFLPISALPPGGKKKKSLCQLSNGIAALKQKTWVQATPCTVLLTSKLLHKVVPSRFTQFSHLVSFVEAFLPFESEDTSSAYTIPSAINFKAFI